MKYFVVILVCMAYIDGLFAQRTVTVNASAIYDAPLTMSPVEA